MTSPPAMVRDGVTVYGTCTHAQVGGVRLTEWLISSRSRRRWDPCCPHRAQFSQGSEVANLWSFQSAWQSGGGPGPPGCSKDATRLSIIGSSRIMMLSWWGHHPCFACGAHQGCGGLLHLSAHGHCRPWQIRKLSLLPPSNDCWTG